MGCKTRLRAPDSLSSELLPPISSFSPVAAEEGTAYLCVSRLSACCLSLCCRIPREARLSLVPSAPAPGARLCVAAPSLMICVLLPPSLGTSAVFHTLSQLPLGLPPGVTTLSPRGGADPGSWPRLPLAIPTEPPWLSFPPPQPVILPPATAWCWWSFLRG